MLECESEGAKLVVSAQPSLAVPGVEDNTSQAVVELTRVEHGARKGITIIALGAWVVACPIFRKVTVVVVVELGEGEVIDREGLEQLFEHGLESLHHRFDHGHDLGDGDWLPRINKLQLFGWMPEHVHLLLVIARDVFGDAVQPAFAVRWLGKGKPENPLTDGSN
jgi:hypothetical protein